MRRPQALIDTLQLLKTKTFNANANAMLLMQNFTVKSAGLGLELRAQRGVGGGMWGVGGSGRAGFGFS